MLESITKFIEGTLLLQVNKDKTKVAYLAHGMKFLGFGFYRNPKSGVWKPTVHKKSKAKLLEKMKAVLDRRCPRRIEATQILLKQVIRGWANYYGIAIQTAGQIRGVDERIRRRIRQLILKAWKRKWTRFQRLKEIYAGKCTPKRESSCIRVAFSSQGHWALAQTANSVLTNQWLDAQGWTWVAKELKLE